MPSATGSAINGLGMASIRSRATAQSVRISFPNRLQFTLPEQTEIVTRASSPRIVPLSQNIHSPVWARDANAHLVKGSCTAVQGNEFGAEVFATASITWATLTGFVRHVSIRWHGRSRAVPRNTALT